VLILSPSYKKKLIHKAYHFWSCCTLSFWTWINKASHKRGRHVNVMGGHLEVSHYSTRWMGWVFLVGKCDWNRSWCVVYWWPDPICWEAIFLSECYRGGLLLLLYLRRAWINMHGYALSRENKYGIIKGGLPTNFKSKSKFNLLFCHQLQNYRRGKVWHAQSYWSQTTSDASSHHTDSTKLSPPRECGIHQVTMPIICLW
jgi:hypothetical protein